MSNAGHPLSYKSSGPPCLAAVNAGDTVCS